MKLYNLRDLGIICPKYIPTHGTLYWETWLRISLPGTAWLACITFHITFLFYWALRRYRQLWSILPGKSRLWKVSCWGSESNGETSYLGGQTRYYRNERCTKIWRWEITKTTFLFIIVTRKDWQKRKL